MNVPFLLFHHKGGTCTVSAVMVSVLDSRSNSQGSSPDRGQGVVCSKAKYFTLTVPLSTQDYKLVPANLCWVITLQWTSIPSRGSRNAPSHFMQQKLG